MVTVGDSEFLPARTIRYEVIDAGEHYRTLSKWIFKTDDNINQLFTRRASRAIPYLVLFQEWGDLWRTLVSSRHYFQNGALAKSSSVSTSTYHTIIMCKYSISHISSKRFSYLDLSWSPLISDLGSKRFSYPFWYPQDFCVNRIQKVFVSFRSEELAGRSSRLPTTFRLRSKNDNHKIMQHDHEVHLVTPSPLPLTPTSNGIISTHPSLSISLRLCASFPIFIFNS